MNLKALLKSNRQPAYSSAVADKLERQSLSPLRAETSFYQCNFLQAGFKRIKPMLSEVLLTSMNSLGRAQLLLPLVERLMRELTGALEAPSTDSTVNATAAAAYHLGCGGHRVRARLCIDAGLALGLLDDDVVCLATAAELLHNASLIHDDLQDHDEIRRGQAAVWLKFGSHVAICAGDLLLSAAYAALGKFSKPSLLPALMALVHQRCTAAISGQCADLAHRNDCVSSVDRYVSIAVAKSGALLALPVELPLLATGNGASAPDARRAAEAFSVSYQIVDDLQDVNRDAECVQGATGLNIVFVLEAQGLGKDARTAAKNCGLQYLHLAVTVAHTLPNGVGVHLLKLASELRAVLMSEPD